jgi:cysteine-rich repeat protein
MKLGRIVLVALAFGGVATASATGCSLIVDFDASKIDGGAATVDTGVDDTADTATPDVADTTPGDTSDDAAETTADAADASDAAETTADASDAAETTSDAADAAETTSDAADAAETAAPVCGNNVVESGEQCDHGSTNGTEKCAYGTPSCQVCSATCQLVAGATSVCGDGTKDTAGGEQCDDGTNNGKLACTYGDHSCTKCSTGCMNVAGTTSYCGDGTKDATNGEECDEGSGNGTACPYGQMSCTVCTTSCKNAAGTTAYCGDGIKNGSESCDDGGTTPGDGCSGTCTVETGFNCTGVPSVCTSICGDGIVVGTETCDDGTSTGLGGCSSGCQVKSGYKCFGAPSICGITAGDGDVLFDHLYHGSSPSSPATETVGSKSYKYFQVQGGGAISSTASYEVYLLAGVGDLTSATVRAWSVVGGGAAAEHTYSMTWVDVVKISGVNYAVWKGVVAPQDAGQTVYYRIWADDGAKRAVLKSAVPSGSSGCGVQTPLSQAVCDSDGYSTDDWTIVIP